MHERLLIPDETLLSCNEPIDELTFIIEGSLDLLV